MGADLYAEFFTQFPGDCRGGDAGGGLPCAGPFEHIPQIVVAVLQCSWEIGVSGYHPGVNLRSTSSPTGPVDMASVQLTKSRFSIHIEIGEPSVTPCRTPPRISALSFSIFHAAAAAVSALAASEVRCDVLLGNRQSRGHTFDDEGQPSSMGFTGGQESEHWYSGRSCLTCGRRLVGMSDE